MQFIVCRLFYNYLCFLGSFTTFYTFPQVCHRIKETPTFAKFEIGPKHVLASCLKRLNALLFEPHNENPPVCNHTRNLSGYWDFAFNTIREISSLSSVKKVSLNLSRFRKHRKDTNQTKHENSSANPQRQIYTCSELLFLTSVIPLSAVFFFLPFLS